ncbi:hypothetical protein P4S72_15125 [Vibrio sp. PP-XX7]
MQTTLYVIAVECQEAVKLKEAIQRRMEDVGLSINESTSNVVYIDTFPRHNVKKVFTFLGYDFKGLERLGEKTVVCSGKCAAGASMSATKSESLKRLRRGEYIDHLEPH